MTTRTKKRILRLAAASLINVAPHPRGRLSPLSTWQALCAGLRQQRPKASFQPRFDAAHELILEFRAMFKSQDEWPYGDLETRCLALLLLANSIE